MLGVQPPHLGDPLGPRRRHRFEIAGAFLEREDLHQVGPQVLEHGADRVAPARIGRRVQGRVQPGRDVLQQPQLN
ncbi:MAG: hypothetical protein U1A27_11470 [Phycisphaerae bacterium]